MAAPFLLGLGWIAGLLAHSLPAGDRWGWIAPMGLALGLAIGCFYRGHRSLARTALMAGLIALLAWVYLSTRAPAPGPQDISFRAPQPRATVIAQVLTDPQTTRSGRYRLWVEAQQIQSSPETLDPVEGQLYITLDQDLLSQLDLHPSQQIRLTGFLYLPSPAQNPGGFDFQRYLNRRGAFAGLSAYEGEILDPGREWGGWALRRRIRGALVRGLGEEQGELLSSMVLGSRAAQLSPEIRDDFRQVGLSHVLAASGFHVSLLIGVLLSLCRRLSPRTQQLILIGGLGLYLVLTGLSPSVARASIMGLAAVIVLTEPQIKGRVEPLGLLLLAAVLLLVWNPNWIHDLGFQLSFLATLGLLVGVQPISQRLDGLPVTLATAMAVPIAAQIWTLPLQMLVFGRVANYFLIANLISLPFVLVLTGVGFGACALSLISPALGAGLAAPLQVLLTPLINLIGWIASWPGATYYVGGMSWIQTCLLYGALGCLTFWPLWRERLRWQGTILLMAALIGLPNLLPGPPLQLTFLATDPVPVMLIQTRQQTILINSGSQEIVRFDLLPFLRRQGIRSLDLGIATVAEGAINGGWGELAAAIPIRRFIDGDGVRASGAYGQALAQLSSAGIPIDTPLPPHPLATRGPVELIPHRTGPLILEIQALTPERSTWMAIGSAAPNAQLELTTASLPNPITGIWWGQTSLSRELLEQLQPQMGVSIGQPQLDPWFQEQGRRLYRLEQTGALRWTPAGIQILGVPLDE